MKNRIFRSILRRTATIALTAALGLNAGMVWGASIITRIPSDPPASTDAGFPYGINDAGVVAIITSNANLATYSGGTLHVAPLQVSDGFLRINSSGQIAGTTLGFTNPSRAFRFTGIPGAGGSAVLLPTLGGDPAIGNGINDQGDVVGSSGVTPGQATSHAFKYVGTPGAGGQIYDLGTLVAGGDSFATAINNAGQITGYASTANRSFHAMLYTGTPGVDGVMRDLGTLGGGSYGTVINSSGQVAGQWLDSNGRQRAFRYTGIPGQDGTMTDLPLLAGSVNGYARDLNDSGFIAGETNDDRLGNPTATLWLPDNTPVNLDAWLDMVDPVEGAKWRLRTAWAINNNGIITGTGNYNDGPGGLPDGQAEWMLDASALVPEPGSMALLALGIPLAFRRSRRSCAAISTEGRTHSLARWDCSGLCSVFSTHTQRSQKTGRPAYYERWLRCL